MANTIKIIEYTLSDGTIKKDCFMSDKSVKQITDHFWKHFVTFDKESDLLIVEYLNHKPVICKTFEILDTGY